LPGEASGRNSSLIWEKERGAGTSNTQFSDTHLLCCGCKFIRPNKQYYVQHKNGQNGKNGEIEQKTVGTLERLINTNDKKDITLKIY
jgi:hypothetical protein